VLSRQSDAGRGKSAAVNAAVKKDAVRTSSAAVAASVVVDEAEVNNLLSQYLPGPANNTATQPTGKSMMTVIFIMVTFLLVTGHF